MYDKGEAPDLLETKEETQSSSDGEGKAGRAAAGPQLRQEGQGEAGQDRRGRRGEVPVGHRPGSVSVCSSGVAGDTARRGKPAGGGLGWGPQEQVLRGLRTGEGQPRGCRKF